MYNPIDSLGPLADLAALEELWLYESDVASLQPLAGLTALRVLVIQSNAQPLADLTPLEDLTSLTTLYLSGCHVNDLDGLDGLIGLETLVLSHNDIVSDNNNLAEIGALPSLVTLYLDDNQIANPSLLGGLAALQALYLDDNDITQISGWTGLTALRTLSLNRNALTTAAGLAGLFALESLRLEYNQLTNVNDLGGLYSLETLYLGHNSITQISGWTSLTALRELYIEYNGLTTTTGLAGLSELQVVRLNNNQVADLAGFAALPRLHNLYLHNNQITVLTPLLSNWQGIGTGDYIDLHNNPLTQNAACSQVPFLRAVGAYVYYPTTCPGDNSDGDSFTDLDEIAYLRYFYLDPADLDPLAPDSVAYQWLHDATQAPPDTLIGTDFSCIPTSTLTIEVEGQGEVWPAPGEHSVAKYDIGCTTPCSEVLPHPCEGNSNMVALSAAPAEGWIFKEWQGLHGDEPNEAATYTDAAWDNHLRAVFVERPGMEELDLVSDLECFLDYLYGSNGQTPPDVNTFDYNGVSYDANAERIFIGNGIPDAAELYLLEAALRMPDLNLARIHGIVHGPVWAAWAGNLELAQNALGSSATPCVARIVAAFMTLGDFASVAAIEDLLGGFSPPYCMGDSGQFDRTRQHFLFKESDADSDGVANTEEWMIAAAAGGATDFEGFASLALGLEPSNRQDIPVQSGSSSPSPAPEVSCRETVTVQLSTYHCADNAVVHGFILPQRTPMPLDSEIDVPLGTVLELQIEVDPSCAFRGWGGIAIEGLDYRTKTWCTVTRSMWISPDCDCPCAVITVPNGLEPNGAGGGAPTADAWTVDLEMGQFMSAAGPFVNTNPRSDLYHAFHFVYGPPLSEVSIRPRKLSPDPQGRDTSLWGWTARYGYYGYYTLGTCPKIALTPSSFGNEYEFSHPHVALLRKRDKLFSYPDDWPRVTFKCPRSDGGVVTASPIDHRMTSILDDDAGFTGRVQYYKQHSLRLDAHPYDGWEFDRWIGIPHTKSSVVLKPSDPKPTGVVFTEIPCRLVHTDIMLFNDTLSVFDLDYGTAGYIMRLPGWVVPGWPGGDVAYLEAVPHLGYVFVGWDGDGSDINGAPIRGQTGQQLLVNLDSEKRVIAMFRAGSAPITIGSPDAPSQTSAGANPVAFDGGVTDWGEPDAVCATNANSRALILQYKHFRDSMWYPLPVTLDLEADICDGDGVDFVQGIWEKVSGGCTGVFESEQGSRTTYTFTDGSTAGGLHEFEFTVAAQAQPTLGSVLIPLAGGETADWLLQEVQSIPQWADDWMAHVEEAALQEGVDPEQFLPTAFSAISAAAFDYEGVSEVGDAPTRRYSYTDYQAHFCSVLIDDNASDWDDPSYATLRGIVVHRCKINNLLWAVFGRSLGYMTHQLALGAHFNQILRSYDLDSGSSQAAIGLGGALYDDIHGSGGDGGFVLCRESVMPMQTPDTPTGLNDVNLWPCAAQGGGFDRPMLNRGFGFFSQGASASRE